FLHCDLARALWCKLVGVMGECWVCPDSLSSLFQIRFRGFGSSKDLKILWRYAFFATVWVVWLERNRRVFLNKHWNFALLWDRVVFLASLWAKAVGAFRDYSLSALHRSSWIDFL